MTSAIESFQLIPSHTPPCLFFKAQALQRGAVGGAGKAPQSGGGSEPKGLRAEGVLRGEPATHLLG